MRAQLDLDTGNGESAVKAAAESLPVVRASGFLRVEAQALVILGVGASLSGHSSEAVQLLKESLGIWNEGDRVGAARTLVELGRIAFDAQDLVLAAAFLTNSLTVSREIGDPSGAAAAFDLSAALAVESGQAERGVRLIESAAALRKRAHIAQSPRDAAWLDQHARSARRALSAARYTAAVTAGRAMTMAQAFELAFSRESVGQIRILTGRETEVVRPVSAGKTNRQIAAQLVIAMPTAERHAANILKKLGVRSRGQIAVWAVDHGLRSCTSGSTDRS